MNIRTKLTVRFIVITAVIIALSSVLIYVLSADYREEDFYERLTNKANNTAKLLIEVDEVDVNLLRRLERDNPVSLPNEKIIIYNFRDTLLFSTDEEELIKIDKALIDRIRLENEIRWKQGEFEVLGFLYKGIRQVCGDRCRYRFLWSQTPGEPCLYFVDRVRDKHRGDFGFRLGICGEGVAAYSPRCETSR